MHQVKLVISAVFIMSFATKLEAQQVTAVAEQPGATVRASETKTGGMRVEGDKCYYPRTKATESIARKKCLNELIPKRPHAIVQTPGSFFIGQAWGKKDKQFVFGPAAGLGAAFIIPIARPILDEKSGGDGANYEFTLPSSMKGVLDLAISLNGNLTGVVFTKDAEEGASDAESAQTQMGFSAGVFIGIQPGVTWFVEKDGKKEQYSLMLSLGMIAAYLGAVERLGNAFLLGFQPGLVATF